MIRSAIVILLLSWLGHDQSPLLGQYQVSDQLSVNFGLSFSLGSHVNRLGLFVETAYVLEEQLQFSAGLRTYYNWKSYGPPIPRDELQFSLGALLGFGPRDDRERVFYSPASNQTAFHNSLCYLYNFYLDNSGTSQRTATIGLQFGKFSLLVENDAFADAILDRFRTGALMVAWEEGNTRVAINSLLWTGDPASQGRRNIDTSLYKGARYGAVDLANATYGRYSHGILALQVQHKFNYGQIGRLDLGIDAEKVRHALQNRLIHDAVFVPKAWNTVQNRHVPMLTEEGDSYLFKPEQKIRKSRFFGLLSLNPGIFY